MYRNGLIEQLPMILQVLLAFDINLYRVMPSILHFQPILVFQHVFVFHIKITTFETSHGTLFHSEQLLQAIDATQLQISSQEIKEVKQSFRK